MNNPNTAVLLIGFGGPVRPEEVRPFLESVLEGVRVPQERFDEVLLHYEAIGGRSPYNAITLKQKRALETEFESRFMKLPVFVGFRHSKPGFDQVFLDLKKHKIQKVVGFVLSSFRTYASFEKYTEKLTQAQKNSQAQDITVVMTDEFYKNPLFVSAQSRKLDEALETIHPSFRDSTYVLFSAHSIPVAMSEKSGYAGQFMQTASLIADKLKLKNWDAAYQSRSGNPRDPWLGPDVKEAIEKIDHRKFKQVVLVPVGFLCDNVEVIYDLDIEAKNAAKKNNLRYLRAQTVMDDPEFIAMIADLVQMELEDQF